MFRKELMNISFDYGCFTTPQFTNYQYFVQIFIFVHWILSFWCWRQILSHIVAGIAGYIAIYFLVFLATSHAMKIFPRPSFLCETLWLPLFRNLDLKLSKWYFTSRMSNLKRIQFCNIAHSILIDNVCGIHLNVVIFRTYHYGQTW